MEQALVVIGFNEEFSETFIVIKIVKPNENKLQQRSLEKDRGEFIAHCGQSAKLLYTCVSCPTGILNQ